MAKRADRLKDLGMPKKPMAAHEADMDLEALGDGGAPGKNMESPESGAESDELGAEMHEGAMGKPEDLDHLSDQDLLSELKKRGLMSKSSPVGGAAEHDMEGSDDEEAGESPEEEDQEDEADEAPLAKKLPPKRK